MADKLLSVLRTAVTRPDYIRAVVRGWPAVEGDIPLEASIAVLFAQYMIETGGAACWNYNIGNVKHVKGDGYDYQMLNGVWEGVSPATADQLIAGGQAKADPSADHQKAVGVSRRSVIFMPPHPATWFRAFSTLDEGMAEHLGLLKKRFTKAWPFVLSGDFVAFAHALHDQHYFTADPTSYANGMRRHYDALIASTTYEELLATPVAPLEHTPEFVPDADAQLWDRDGEFAKLVTIAHMGASNLILEDAAAERDRKMREDI